MISSVISVISVVISYLKCTVVGLGLAGSEAAYQLARRGVDVTAYEMRPERSTPAHRTPLCAELVCSNSFRSDKITSGPGLLKRELELAGSLIMDCAGEHRIPAGTAFAVDRARFSEAVTKRLDSLESLTIVRREVDRIPDCDPVILATGPLTSDALYRDLAAHVGTAGCHFFDAISPRIYTESIDQSLGYWASRYGQGDGSDYFNCPLTRDEYRAFVDALAAAVPVIPHMPEDGQVRFFEGCLPAEEMARRGQKTLAFGPMKPVGLPDPRTGKPPYAVVQLRRDNREGTILGLVGFQTCLPYPDQKLIFRMIPALRHAEFAQLGSIHLNRYIHSPSHLTPTLQLRSLPRVFVAGQLSGVEGYIESAATGLAAAWSVLPYLRGAAPEPLPASTAIGSLCRYVSTDSRSPFFQPQNINFGILGGDATRPREEQAATALASLKACLDASETWTVPSSVSF